MSAYWFSRNWCGNYFNCMGTANGLQDSCYSRVRKLLNTNSSMTSSSSDSKVSRLKQNLEFEINYNKLKFNSFICSEKIHVTLELCGPTQLYGARGHTSSPSHRISLVQVSPRLCAVLELIRIGNCPSYSPTLPLLQIFKAARHNI